MAYSDSFEPESKDISPDETTRLTIPPVYPKTEANYSGPDNSRPDHKVALSKGPRFNSTSGSNTVAVGSTLKDRFIIEKEIARGGMGVVYRARDIRKVQYEDRNPYLAIKVIGEECKAHPDSFIALQREAGKAQMLAHPNIVTVYDFDSDGDTVFMTMEFLEGESLQRRFLKQGSRKMPMRQALSIIEAVVKGLAYAHQKGIVHCDLKPGNIFLTDDGNIKILDFGIARAAKHTDNHQQETTRFDPATLGALTPAYASCEMMENALPDPRDDIYALACVTYEMLQGHHPFNKMPANVARDNKLKPLPIKFLSKTQWRTLLSGLSFNRESRPASVEEFLEGLREQKPKFRLMRFVSATAFIIILAAAGAFLYDSFQSPAPSQISGVVQNSTQATSKPVVLNAEQQQTVDHLLEAAQIHFMVHRVTEPEGSNAYAAYEHVLEIDPNNTQAKAGLKKIGDYYADLAKQSIAKGDNKKALSMVQIGLKVMSNHAGLLSIKNQIEHQSIFSRFSSWVKNFVNKFSG